MEDVVESPSSNVADETQPLLHKPSKVGIMRQCMSWDMTGHWSWKEAESYLPVLEWLPRYQKRDLLPDCVAGLTVAV